MVQDAGLEMKARMRAILLAEIEEREQAAAEMNRLERPDRADAIRAEARLAASYLSRP